MTDRSSWSVNTLAGKPRTANVLTALRLVVLAAIALAVIYPGTPVGWRLAGGTALACGVLLLVLSAAVLPDRSGHRLAELLIWPPRFRRSGNTSRRADE